MHVYLKLATVLALFVSPNQVLGAQTSLDTGHTAWLLTATALVLFMTLPGLALFYGGLVRTKNVLSVLMQCFAIACVSSVVWFAFGYSLAFGDGGALNGFIGNLAFFSSGIDMNADTAYPTTVFVMFQMTFAIITPALIIGGFAERMRFGPMLIFSTLWLIFVYLPVCHWVWGGGWLAEMGFKDFAGGAVVHINAGVAALVAAIIIGKRRGFPVTAMPPHNLTMTVMGASMLWVGWFGFNAGSALAADSAAGMAMLVTHLGAASGSIAWMVVEWLKFGKPSVLGIVTGMVAGLGTITPASGFVGPEAALVIGALAGVVCFYATQLIKRRLQIDDSLDVFPVHGVGGILGTLLTAVFLGAGMGGVGLDDGTTTLSQLGVQVVGIVATAAWCGIISIVLLKIIDAVSGLRVDIEEELEGLDIILHDERGYDL